MDMLAATPLFSHRYSQAVGIFVQGDTSAEILLRLLDAGHVSFDHSLVEFIKIRNAQTRLAPSGRNLSRIVPFKTGRFARVERQCRGIDCELGLSRRLESQGQPLVKVCQKTRRLNRCMARSAKPRPITLYRQHPWTTKPRVVQTCQWVVCR